MDKVALVTGAGRGIGLAAARRFLADGWRVALLDIDAGLLAAAMASLAAPDSTLALECDVADAGAVFPAVQRAAQRFGRLDALVNNAGDRGVQAAAGDDAGGMEPRAGGEPGRAVPHHPGGGTDHGGRRRRRPW